jgi:hypothetical protein
MKTKSHRTKPSFIVRLLNVLMVIALLVSVILFSRMISEIRSSYARDQYGSIAYSLREGDYGDMVREYYRRAYDIAPFKTEYEEEYHLAAYADAAFRYLFFVKAGDESGAERTARKMETERSLTGSLSSLTGEIDEILEEIPPKAP